MNFQQFLNEQEINSSLVITNALDTINESNQPIQQSKVGTDKKTPYKKNGVVLTGFLLIDDSLEQYSKDTAQKRWDKVSNALLKQSGTIYKEGSINLNDSTKFDFGTFNIICTPQRINVVSDNSGQWRTYMVITVT